MNIELKTFHNLQEGCVNFTSFSLHSIHYVLISISLYTIQYNEDIVGRECITSMRVELIIEISAKGGR